MYCSSVQQALVVERIRNSQVDAERKDETRLKFIDNNRVFASNDIFAKNIYLHLELKLNISQFYSFDIIIISENEVNFVPEI